MCCGVSLEEMTIGSLFEKTLKIPNYQRIYCWRYENVSKFLQTLLDAEAKRLVKYNLGNIILHKKGDELDIVDGQQRLVTLTLILKVIQSKESSNISLPLLQEKFESKNAQEHIIFNFSKIQNYFKHKSTSENLSKFISEQIVVNVLTINDKSVDLAYTFFTNTNSRGKPLSDYDLLKSHHLHYIENQSVAAHLSKQWDRFILESESSFREELVAEKNNSSKDNSILSKDFLVRKLPNIDDTLRKYLFFLRKWNMTGEWDESIKHPVKIEYESAPLISEIPPFGENFSFFEPIQGGTHFFAYTSIFMDRCNMFKQTKVFEILDKLNGESHTCFRDVAEAVLFAYYLKFAEQYIAEALFCILRIISLYRYETTSIDRKKIRQNKVNFWLVRQIVSASSPSFFLAKSIEYYQDYTNRYSFVGKDSPIQKRYRKLINKILDEIEESKIIKSESFLNYIKLFKDENKIKEE